MEWFYAKDGQQAGPVSEDELNRLVREGLMPPTTLVWRAGLDNWVTWSSLHPAPPSGGAFSAGPVGAPPIATAYGSAAGFVYAGFWIRVLAYIIDGAILDVARRIILAPMGITMLERPFRSGWFFTHAGEAGSAWIVIGIAYFVYFWTQHGATPGKMLLKLKVVNVDGSQISVGQAVGRYFAIILDWITCGIGFVIAGMDDQKRALHDRICETRVIRVSQPPMVRYQS